MQQFEMCYKELPRKWYVKLMAVVFKSVIKLFVFLSMAYVLMRFYDAVGVPFTFAAAEEIQAKSAKKTLAERADGWLSDNGAVWWAMLIIVVYILGEGSLNLFHVVLSILEGLRDYWLDLCYDCAVRLRQRTAEGRLAELEREASRLRRRIENRCMGAAARRRAAVKAHSTIEYPAVLAAKALVKPLIFLATPFFVLLELARLRLKRLHGYPVEDSVMRYLDGAIWVGEDRDRDQQFRDAVMALVRMNEWPEMYEENGYVQLNWWDQILIGRARDRLRRRVGLLQNCPRIRIEEVAVEVDRPMLAIAA